MFDCTLINGFGILAVKQSILHKILQLKAQKNCKCFSLKIAFQIFKNLQKYCHLLSLIKVLSIRKAISAFLRDP